ncbi:hypothetical protein EJ04DRAFT_153456 [Polyplosphaeria fusca]|uniref:Uncharacterized protein n=1 Tax=Polyplosphaeria fusca TaxID=682080 RepID=A0A9P4QZB1_9PLEO|nr:hypothetical protein EJ04DRAFT_153456 [Polyplosphaeria fusca]
MVILTAGTSGPNFHAMSSFAMPKHAFRRGRVVAGWWAAGVSLDRRRTGPSAIDDGGDPRRSCTPTTSSHSHLEQLGQLPAWTCRLRHADRTQDFDAQPRWTWQPHFRRSGLDSCQPLPMAPSLGRVLRVRPIWPGIAASTTASATRLPTRELSGRTAAMEAWRHEVSGHRHLWSPATFHASRFINPNRAMPLSGDEQVSSWRTHPGPSSI